MAISPASASPKAAVVSSAEPARASKPFAAMGQNREGVQEETIGMTVAEICRRPEISPGEVA